MIARYRVHGKRYWCAVAVEMLEIIIVGLYVLKNSSHLS